MSEPVRAPCPTCRREVVWTEAAPFRPFCSERCRMIDLGAWLDERHVIPGDEKQENIGISEKDE
jgi:endogenous inhibitor of DNA gyrase (YacG/DUF329 family)